MNLVEKLCISLRNTFSWKGLPKDGIGNDLSKNPFLNKRPINPFSRPKQPSHTRICQRVTSGKSVVTNVERQLR
jgi:hypothetical protein